ncbi:hypothetical protein [Salegentibacter mishustinae]|jgi:hypothetical protein|uniref:hypothetical protein n=1 Tax=Salegentibacter mishustinae TaxID=270918 RepID=UPI00249301EB|nr:hypothetical protein [Salegentibacter mishustinae]|tara:strand:- start:205 stop:423 length:219 start_codon:yes stop_codon:yes gene_type:complete
MELIGIIAISLFLIITFLFWRFTKDHFRQEYGQKRWKKWVTRTFYWQGAIFVGTGGAFLILFILKWTNVLTF